MTREPQPTGLTGLLAALGASSMGEVWKARDTRIDHIVAIKRLERRHSAPFEQEVLAIDFELLEVLKISGSG